MDDGMIEVIGLTTYQLPLLQAGGHGTCLAQCKSAKIVTSKTIPMQVDGEAIRLNPANIGKFFLPLIFFVKINGFLLSRIEIFESMSHAIKNNHIKRQAHH